MPGPGYIIVAIKVTNVDSASLEHDVRGQSASAYASTATQSLLREKRKIVSGLKDVLNGIAGGTVRGDLWVAIPGTNAALHTRTITCTQATSAGSDVTLACGGVSIVLTEGTDFARGASDTTEATALAAALNANTTFREMFTITSATNVVTIAAKFPGNLFADWTITGDTGLVVATSVQGTQGTARIPIRNVGMGHTP